MNLKYFKWNEFVLIPKEKSLVLVIPEINELALFQKTIYDEIIDSSENILITDDDKVIKFEKNVEIISDPLMVVLNSRKVINNLHKELSEEISKSDLVLTFEKINEEIKEWLMLTRKKTFIDFEFEERVDTVDIFNLFKVKYKERKDEPIILLIKYIELLYKLFSIKIVFISFMFYFFQAEEIIEFINHFKGSDLKIIFIEKEKPKEIQECETIVKFL